MSTVRDLLVSAAGAGVAAACGSWAVATAGRGVLTVDELVALAAAGTGTALGAWYTLTSLALLLARLASRSAPRLATATALRRAVGTWGAPLLRQAAVAGAGAGLALGMVPAGAAGGEPPAAPVVETVDDVPLDLRPGFVELAGADQDESVDSDDEVADHGPGAQHSIAISTEAYLVQPGDSLWSITADSLGPGATDAEVAAEWPRWYRTNRAVVGTDPDLIHPGQELLAPDPKDTP